MGGVSQVTVTPQGVQHVGVGGAVRRERCFQLGNREGCLGSGSRAGFKDRVV